MTDQDLITQLALCISHVEDLHQAQANLNTELRSNVKELYDHVRKLQTDQAALEATSMLQHQSCPDRHTKMRTGMNFSFRQLIILIATISCLAVGGNYIAKLLPILGGG